ncbi:C-type lectin domain family 4 member M-like [Megalobrama amblycephala]|uniref:C-type lectin domain family 4 member M-like n=1 Tax=Megalobrama amblycephala TaxID=75352 RepID=UPI0020142002|nr:C-type lectin domain family 4 member M-like [Megalobrama amblycephala]
MCKRNSTGIDSVRNRRYKRATVCLVLQCVLLVEAIILLGLELRTKTDEYENSEDKYNQQRNKERDEIQGLLKEKDKLEKDISNTTNQNNQLNEEKKQLLAQFLDGWKCNQSSLYYISSDTKNWAESREDCLNRGADLIIINNREEQESFKTNAEFWIGLNDSDVEGTWKWVDGSTLTSGFWASGQPNMGKEENCAVLNPLGWYGYPCDNVFKWICERKKAP